ncbi:hypothetical protein OG948_28520 [Embleya sp. NBC_00888]|uniref:hypothetical protein n=1 Tax=Embleya sp. NBC_00888 TaxID=2975960 RepID=UPI00386BE05B|nr:hypothetical protein OG948_28520 [Embleya sp. NBC_00888]
MMEIQGYRAIQVGTRVRHVDEHADLPEGTVVALPAASTRVAVVQPSGAGRSPYLCPIGHLVALDSDGELARVVAELRRVDQFGCAVGGPLSVPITPGGESVRETK